MPVNQFLILSLAIGGALLLILVGLIIRLRHRSAAEQPKTTPADKLAPDWINNLAGAAGKTLGGEASFSNLQLDGIVITRDPASDEWWVEVNGTRYRTLKEIHDDRAARKVLEALSGLQRFAGSIPIVAAPAPTSPRSTPAPTSTTAPSPKIAAPKDSMLHEIDSILQHNLLRQTDLVDRVIHIGAAQDGTLLIEVDRQYYPSVEEIPEQIVREMIKASIQEWERA